MPKGVKYGGRKAGTANLATREIKALAQNYTCNALETLANIMLNSDSDAARVSAAKELLDRGHGRSSQTIKGEINMKDEVLSSRLIEAQQRLLQDVNPASGANPQSITSPPP